MWLVLLVSASMAVALPSSRSDEDRVIDLQELLLNVSDSYRDFGQGMKDLGSVLSNNLKLIVENANTNARRSDVNAKLIIENVNANSNESTGILKLILEALGKSGTTTTAHQDDRSTTTTAPPIQGQDCSELYKKGERSSGPYPITLPRLKEAFKVYCDMKTDGGGWTVFQRRGDFGNPKDYFARTWEEYKNGFGEVEKEFWLGNDRISALTQQKEYALRVDLWDFEGNWVYAKYNVFRVDNERQLYRLNVQGFSGGSAGDSLTRSQPNHNAQFTTKDRQNDGRPQGQSCSLNTYGRGGWWYHKDCGMSNLNGLNEQRTSSYQGIWWWSWKVPPSTLAFTEMKMRPTDF